jgi:tRNA-2-methylthio-N6-dimethylallyladenosine synthase
MNRSDSERIARVLEDAGYQGASKIEEADLVVVNMCSVRQSAVDRVYGLTEKFTKLKAKSHKLKTVLTGCILKKDRKKFSGAFDLILDIKDLSKWPEVLSNGPKFPTCHRRSRGQMAGRQVSSFKNYFQIPPLYQSPFRAYIPIMTGCNNFCTYCVVPYTRGPEVSRPVKEILCEVEKAVQEGAKEIWLLGQNVNSYRSYLKSQNSNLKSEDKKSKIINFPELLKMIDDTPGEFWIRFTSSHPKDFSDELIETMAESKKVTPYLNLPVQSGDNEILKKMKRPYTIEQYRAIVKQIRQRMPDICLSTDIIVGFPGETKKHFENTKKLMEEIKFDMAYIAQFSSRPGTLAAKMKNDVPQPEKQRREKVLTEILKETALEKNKKYVGKVVETLVLKYKTHNLKNFYLGKTYHYKTVKFQASEKLRVSRFEFQDLVGQFVKVKITDALPWGLKGTLL